MKLIRFLQIILLLLISLDNYLIYSNSIANNNHNNKAVLNPFAKLRKILSKKKKLFFNNKFKFQENTKETSEKQFMPNYPKLSKNAKNPKKIAFHTKGF